MKGGINSPQWLYGSYSVSLPPDVGDVQKVSFGQSPEFQLPICRPLTGGTAATLPLHRIPDSIALRQSHPPIDDGRRQADVAGQPVRCRQPMHCVGCHGGGEVGEGGDAAGAFQGRGDDDFEAAGAGAQGEFGAGEEAAVAGGFDDEAAHGRVAEKSGVDQVLGFVDGEREVGACLQLG